MAGLQGTEEGFLQQVKELAVACGWLAYHTRRSKGSDPGFPDLVLVKRGKLLFWELKMKPARVKAGRLTDAQLDWAAELEPVTIGTLGRVEYRVLRPEDWDDIEKTLKEE